MVEKKINLNSLLKNLIKEHEELKGVTRFIAKKIGNDFVYADMTPNLYDILKNCNLAISKYLKETVFEKAWNGQEMTGYVVFSDKETIMVYHIKKISENLEGHCVLLNTKSFEGFLDL